MLVLTAVSKTACRESGRVRFLDPPRMEDELAVARAPFAKRMDPARGCGSTPPSPAEESKCPHPTPSSSRSVPPRAVLTPSFSCSSR